MRVVWYSGDERGTCGFMCGKHGCWGPHSSAGLGGPSEPMIEVLLDDKAGPMPASRDVWDALRGSSAIPPGWYCGSGPRSISVDMFAFPFPLSIVRPDCGDKIPFFCSAPSWSSIARPFPLSRVGVIGETVAGEASPLFLLAISMLTLRGNETRLLVPAELPLRSTCKLALVDPECRFCLCSGSVNNGYSPPAPAPSLGLLRSGCSSGIAITGLSSGDLFRRLAAD